MQASLALAGASVLPKAWAAPANQPLGVQLFTLFGQIEKDVKGNMQQLAQLGYKEIESAFSFLPGFYGMSAKEWDGFLKSIGLNWVSHHVIGAPFKPRPGMDTSRMPKFLNLRDNSDEVIEGLVGTGLKYLVCANIPVETRKEMDEAVEILLKVGKKAKAAGLTFCFHNHDAEFKAVDGLRPFDLFSKEIPTELLKFELDLGWASKAKVDPVQLFQAQPGRFPLCHIKDFDREFKEILPLGEGHIDYARIFAAAKQGGLQHYFIEHDMPKDAFASLKTSKMAFDRL